MSPLFGKPAPKNAPPPSGKIIQGPIEKVPCPHCGKPNDVASELTELNMVEPGVVLICDFCHKKMQIVKVTIITMVAVRQTRG